MTRLVLTDQLIADALRPDPSVAAPAGLLAQIATDVARTQQRRSLPLLTLPWSRQLAWIAVGAATLVALAAALLFASGGSTPFQVSLPPAPSSRPAQLLDKLPYEGTFRVALLGLDADEAWAVSGTRLWHRTAAGGWVPVAGGPPWDPPVRPIDSAVSGIRDLARLPDGRVVVGAESGVFVGDPSGWTTVWQEPGGWIFDVEVDAAGTIWAAGGLDAQGVALRSFEAVGGAWRETRHPGCPAGGMLVAPASDGTVWTAGIGYSGTSGLARLDGESCTEVFPFGDDARHDVTAIAADGRGRVAAIVIDTWSGGSPDHVGGGRLLEWEDGRWTTLYEDEVLGVFGNVLSYAPDGTLWAAMDWKLWRFVGREATAVRDVDALGVSVAPDGAVWYVGRASVVTRLLPDEAQP